MNAKALTILFFLPVLAFGQTPVPKQVSTLTYSMDTIRRDSFFLVETVSTTTDGKPRPETSITPQLFRDPAQLDAYVAYLEDEAKKANDQALRYAQAAQLSALKAQLIGRLKEQHTWWGAATQPILKPTLPLVPNIPETKPVKKKRAKKKQ